MHFKPLATLIIVTRNRINFLSKMLYETRKQVRYKDLEIVVANDGGESDFSEKFKLLFPEINFLYFPEQLGLIKLRNDLFKISDSEFVFFLDDDSWFDQEDAIVNALEVFKDYPEAGILNFRVKLRTGEMIPSIVIGKEPYNVGSFIGCAHAIRKSFFLNSDIYDEDYFRQGEERDLSIKCIEKGYNIMQVNNIIVCHNQVEAGRDHQFIHGYAFRNEVFFYLKYFPVILSTLFVLRCIISHAIYCFRKRWYRSFFFGASRISLDFPKFIKKRNPVKFSTVRKYIFLNYKLGK